MSEGLAIVMIGATGAVGQQVVRTLTSLNDGPRRLTLLGRRQVDGPVGAGLSQHIADIFDPRSFATLLPAHDSAICTLGVGQPSKVSREEFVRTDKIAVLGFARACREAGIARFSLLSSVGADPRSRSFYLRTKGELEDGLAALSFERLSIFQPSMILTPANRYGLTQGVLLTLWPVLHHLLHGSWRKYRGIPVDTLGRAIARDAMIDRPDRLNHQWEEINRLGGRP